MPKTLLLADDSVVIQKLVALSFANEDVELVTVYNGDDAVARAREQRPDLVLADVVMPGRNGYEVCQAVKSDPDLSGVPVLLLTGTFEAFDEDHAREVGADGHITKPFEAQALVERVNALLQAATTPAAAAAAVPAGGGSEAGDGSADFFDDELGEPLAAEEESGAIELDGDFAFGEPGEGADPLALPPEPGGDRTVAWMPDPPAAAPAGDAPTVTASGFAAAADSPPSAPAFDDQATSPGAAAPSPEDSFEPVATPAVNANPDPMATVLADEGESSFGAGAADPAATVLADDLFGDAVPETPAPEAAGPEPAGDPDLDFSFVTAPPTAITPPPDLEPLEPAGEAAPVAEADLDPAGSSAFDVSSSDLGDPLTAVPEEPPPTVATFDETPEPAAFEEAVPAEAVAQPLGSEPAELAATPAEPGPAEGSPFDEPASPAAPAAAQATTAPEVPDLSSVLPERLQETLEKVAWEAFADLSDTVVRQVVERVERVAWEVIPQMAEALIREEIRKLKGDPEA